MPRNPKFDPCQITMCKCKILWLSPTHDPKSAHIWDRSFARCKGINHTNLVPICWEMIVTWSAEQFPSEQTGWQTNVATLTVNRIKGPTLYNDIPLTIKDYMLLKPQYNLMWICFWNLVWCIWWHLWFPGVKYLCRYLNTVECFICLVHNYLTDMGDKNMPLYMTKICFYAWNYHLKSTLKQKQL